MKREILQQADYLLNKIRDTFYHGKTEYPTSIIAVEHDNALYFLYSDAELIAALFRKKLETISGVPFCIIDKEQHNDLAIVLYENKQLMCVISTDPKVPESSLFEMIVENIVKPYNEKLMEQHKRGK